MNKKILLVDDEPDILELIGYNLRQEGYDAVSYTHLTLPTTPYV